MSVEEFKAAADLVQKLKTKPNNDELLKLYGLFKQAEFGDNNTSSPGTFDFKGKAKWSAWNEKKGMSSDTARSEYIKLVNSLVEKYGSN